MALGKKCGSNVKHANEGLGLGLGIVRTRSFGRKRIVILNDMEVYSTFATPTKKQCSGNSILSSQKSPIEAMPQDILIKILCGVDHGDLKRLFHVSKSIREVTLIAKKWHFAYSTPTKIQAFRNSLELKDSSEFNEIEAPNAPKQSRIARKKLSGKKLADISVALFASPDEEGWPRRDLFMEMETEI